MSRLPHFGAQKKAAGRAVASEGKLDLLRALEGKSKREAEVVVADKSVMAAMCDFAHMAMKSERAVDRGDHVEIKLAGSAGLLTKIAKVKGAIARTHPHISHGELFEYLCDRFLAEREKSLTTKKTRVNRVRLRAKNKCENCSSRFALEVDHIRPRACGGGGALENLRLLCRSCNQRAAVRVFGVTKMEHYIGKSKNLP